MPQATHKESRTKRLTASVSQKDWRDAHWYGRMMGYDVSNLMQFMGVRDIVAAAHRLRARGGDRLTTMSRGERMKLLAEDFDRIAKAEERKAS